MDRRDFLKSTAIGAAAIAAAACKRKAASASAPAEANGSEQMEIRVHPKNGDRVSLLGYGCMRWPMIKGDDGKEYVDQETVNSLVDYAYKHGINYYDTAPTYLQGQSESAAGEALSRYPRESYFIATKLSNFGDQSRKGSLQMYRNSFKALRTDYILLSSAQLGKRGYPAFKVRYEDNGMMDFLMKEREAGRICNLGFSFHGDQDAFDELLALNEKYHWDFVQIQMNYFDWRHARKPRNTNAEYLYGELESEICRWWLWSRCLEAGLQKYRKASRKNCWKETPIIP